MSDHPGRVDTSDHDLADLDDVGDREELRTRYYTLLQELRVVLPGVQVLLAFLLAVPFAERFDQLDQAGRTSFGVALLGAMGSVICLLAPTVFHRVAERTARTARLRWAIRMTMAGLALLAVALTAALWCVARLLYLPRTAWLMTVGVVVTMALLWVVVPLVAGRPAHRTVDDGQH